MGRIGKKLKTRRLKQALIDIARNKANRNHSERNDDTSSMEFHSGGLTMIFGHNLFKEGLKAFHPIEGPKFYSNETSRPTDGSKRLHGYLLFDFKLTEDWDFGSFVIEKSIEVCHDVISPIGDECVKSFVSPVLLPEWVKHTNGHFFLLGLSSICSFCIGRPVYSPRDFFLIQEEDRKELLPFIHDNIDDLDAIENLKVIIKTDDEKEVHGRFMTSTQLPIGDIKWSINIRLDDNKIISVLLDANLRTVTIQDNYAIGVNEIFVVKNPDLRELSMLLPAKVRGAGPIWDIHSDILKQWKGDIDLAISNLFSLKYEGTNKEISYKKAIQAMRLVQLAHQNHKEDFDLSFSLLVSATEAMAQIAIPQNKIKPHPEHNNWKKKAKTDSEFKKFFDHYIELRQYVNADIQNRDLSDRFVNFILKHYPIENWKVVDEQELRYGLGENIFKTDYNKVRKSEEKPEDFTPERLNKIIKNTYKYRSGFFHEGKSTPHFIPVPNHIHRYFQTVHDEKELNDLTKTLANENRNTLTAEESNKIKINLINHDLMKMIAKESIYNYLNNA